MSELDSNGDLLVVESDFENEFPGSPFTVSDEAMTNEGEKVLDVFQF